MHEAQNDIWDERKMIPVTTMLISGVKAKLIIARDGRGEHHIKIWAQTAHTHKFNMYDTSRTQVYY